MSHGQGETTNIIKNKRPRNAKPTVCRFPHFGNLVPALPNCKFGTPEDVTT
ncbi:Uncharacterized protein dnm_044460 [Desulfonema magnum]|uniref:Uncharacterized protein n=1 Tax=Desulfonema magnum TaxID=45655 RepID=A0A975BMW9_9BACT|nr:Uncharacterized protein dnm_044460 [Desulfonema magnum]